MAREEVDEKMSSTNGIADGTNGITLRECPHCGNTEALTVKHCDGPGENPDQSRVVCDFTKGGCGASGGVRYTEVEAIEAWNTRATRKPTDAVREFAEHVAEDTRRRESAAWTAAARQAVDDCEKHMKELEDEYVEMCCTFQRLLCELSGGKLSKPNVEYGEMVSVIDEEYERIYNEEYKELRDRIAELEAERDMFKTYIERKEHIHRVFEKDKRIAELEAEDRRTHADLYASIREKEAMEGLIRDMWTVFYTHPYVCVNPESLKARAEALGIEVD